MKTLKVLAALAFPAIFAACTSEDLNIEAPMQNQEVVGAKLIGTDIAISVEKGGVESRYANGGWESTDLLGMGWVTKDNGFVAQSQTKTPNTPELYANNMFSLEDGVFRTKGNIYEGWHFAYYPFVRMEKLGVKDINLNPEQTCEWLADGGDRYKNFFALSAMHFLGESDVDAATNKLSDEKSFKTYFIANEIPVQLIPNEDFVGNKYLNNLTIKDITLDAGSGKNVFKYQGTLNAQNIPAAVDKNGKSLYVAGHLEYDETKTKEVLFEKVPQIFNLTATKSIVTRLETAGLTTGANGITRFFTLPYKYATPETPDVVIAPTITIKVDGGTFKITKVTDSEALKNPLAVANNAVLETLVAAYKNGGAMTKDEGMLALNLNLYPEIFAPDFAHISTLKEWTNCVNVAKALGMEGPLDFTLINDIEFTGTSIPLPNVKVNVLGGKKMIIKKTLKAGWPTSDKLNVAATDVVFDAPNTIAYAIAANNITNNDELTISGGTSTQNIVTINVNNGKIIVNKNAVVNNVDNTSGRIQIIPGGIANTTVAGTIYYEVQKNDKAARINDVITKGNVNTLLVKSGITLNLNKIDAATTTEGDYDSSSTPEVEIDPANLTGITLEMAGGVVEGKLGVFTVNSIVVENGATNKTIDLVANDITVKAGTLTLDATIPVGGVKNVLDMKAATNVDVKEAATLIANADTHVNHLTNAGTVKANTGYLFHFNSHNNSGTLTGNVELCNCVIPEPEPNYAELESALKTAWDVLKNIQGAAFTQDYIVTTIKGLTPDQVNTSTKSGTIYLAMKAWFEAKGIEFSADNTQFKAEYITIFNFLNEGTANDLTF